MQIDFAKDRYDYELKRSDQLTAALTLPVGVLSGLGGLMVAMARSFAFKTFWLTVPFGFAFGADVLAFFSCLVYLARAYHSQEYICLPLLKDLEGWEEEDVALRASGNGHAHRVFRHGLVLLSKQRPAEHGDSDGESGGSPQDGSWLQACQPKLAR